MGKSDLLLDDGSCVRALSRMTGELASFHVDRFPKRSISECIFLGAVSAKVVLHLFISISVLVV